MNTIFKLKKINVLKFAVVTALIYVLLSFIILIPFSLISGLISHQFAISTIFLFFLPIVYGIIGLISGLLIAFIYNLISKYFGGIEVEVEQIDNFSE